MINFEEINNRIDNNKGSLDELVAFLSKKLYDKNPNGEYITDPYYTFLLCLDKIAPMLYSKDSKDGYYAIELNKYSDGENGYFDKLFEIASLLIRFLIVSDPQKIDGKKVEAGKWNVILKMDTHNNPQGKSRYSLVTPNSDPEGDLLIGNFVIKDKTCKSLAYTLFFDYFEFCNQEKDAGRLEEQDVYTVHKEFINYKTARSFAYETYRNALKKITDGNIDSKGLSYSDRNRQARLGKKHYLDFIRCILCKKDIYKMKSPFSEYLKDEQTDNSWKEGSNSMKSFSYYNLGIQGFESWGTLMIESEDKAEIVYKKFYHRSGDELEDSLLLAKIKNIISALKKIDDDFNDAHNKQKIRHESIKSAKAAIMSRNMSHNLGSHVMSYLKHHLGSVKDMLNDQILSYLFSGEKDFNETMYNPAKWNEREWFKESEKQRAAKDSDKLYATKLALPFLVGLGQFISYLQERQDFIATIATDFIPYFASVNFKDFVYDELNNDKRYNRHPDRKNLKPDNILLGNIARSEGLGRITSPTRQEDNTSLCDIIIKFREHFTGDPVEMIRKHKVFPEKYYKKKDVRLAKSELKAMRKWDVSFPGGVVGRQAVFSIMENVIRNAAKHGNWRKKGKLELTIDVFTKEDLVNRKKDVKRRLRNNDNISGELSLFDVFKRFYLNAKDCDDLFFVTLTDNLDFSRDSLVSLRKAIAEEYVDDSNRMINANKGIKEMRISASWLRNLDDNPQRALINKKNAVLYDKQWEDECRDNAPILYARISKDINVNDDSEGHLQYIFCLLRTQKVAFVSSDFVQKTKEKIVSILSDKSWKIFTPDSYINHSNKSFDFVIYDDCVSTKEEKQNEEFDKLRRYSSLNIFRLSDLGCATDNMLEIKNVIVKGVEFEALSTILDTTLALLYKNRANWDGKEMILIHDARTEQNFKSLKEKERKKLMDKITFSENPQTKYRYVTHLEEKNEFKEYVIDKKCDNSLHFDFSEGITGNNSTDRLIRTEILSEEWFYKHLYCMKKKIAIFDERIFSKVYALEEADFLLNKIPNYRSCNGKELSDNDLITSADRSAAINILPKSKDTINSYRHYKGLERFFNKAQYNPITGSSLTKVETRNHLGATFANKGVFVFSLIRNIEDPSSFNLYGYNENSELTYFSECKKYAKISWNDNTGLSIYPYDNVDLGVLHGFDNISIHQGLLDKLYDVFELKRENSVQQKQQKEELTRKFWEFFVGGDDRIISFADEEDNLLTHYFLPGMAIHSGRSKPSKLDMPQQLPFIQYSAIEQAVLDCKFSLVELLNSARYE